MPAVPQKKRRIKRRKLRRIKTKLKKLRLKKKFKSWFKNRWARRKRKRRRIRRRIRRRRRIRLIHTKRPAGHRFTQEWLNTANAKKLVPAPLYMEFHGGESAALSDAKSADDSKIFSAVNETPDPAYVAVIPRSRVWGRRGSVLTPDNILLTDQSSNFDAGSIHLHPAFHFWNPHRLVSVPETIAAVTFCDTQNYYHWMYDVLVRFHLLSLSGVPIDKYIVNPLNQEFQIETLNLLGIPRERIIETHDHFHLKADRLVLTSPIVFKHYPKWTGDYLREQLMLKHGFNNPHTGPKRIFVRRGNVAKRRNLQNEAKIVSLLDKTGFYCTSLDAMTVKQQIELFHSADVIVAPHGAALTNLTFCRPGTVVVELFNPNYIPNFFWKISNYQGLNYYYVKGKSTPGHDGLWVGAQDFKIDEKLLEKTLKAAGL